MLTTENLIQTLRAAGALGDAVYASMPITSGLREIELAAKLGIGPSDTRVRFSERWESEVLRANEQAGHALAAHCRSMTIGKTVINPSAIHVLGWSQDDYTHLWLRVLDELVGQVVAADNWQFSRGARTEIGFALSRGIDVFSADFEPIDLEQALRFDAAARSHLIALGWSDSDADRYLVPLDGSSSMETRSPAAAVFEWLAVERGYQVSKFGTDLDDEHTLQGLDDDSWWWQQLANYLGRARVLTIDQLNGRQALAKYVATGCGLLESVVRVKGALPPAGVPSGELGGARDSGASDG